MKIERSIAEDIIMQAVSRGADLAELFMITSRSLSAEVKFQEVDAFETASSFGYCLRILKNGSPGFSYSRSLDDWQNVINNSLEASQYTQKDKDYDFAEPASYEKVEIYDPRIAAVSEKDAIEMAMKIEEAAKGFDSRITKVRKAMSSFSESELLLLNSKGFKGSYNTTSASAEIEVVAEDGADAQIGWGQESSRFLDEVDFQATGLEAAERSLRLLGAVKAGTGKGQILLDSSVCAEFLRVLVPSFSSENIYKGKSILIGKKGERIISEKVNLVENALLRGKIGSRPFDAEGIPSREKLLVEEGCLLTYLYTIYTANREGIRSTGNAVRGGIQGMPGVGISNLHFQASSDRFTFNYDDLVRQMDKGIIVTEAMGIHTANPITGDFSVGVSGLWVEKGKVRHPVKEAVISGNILEFFEKVTGIGNKPRSYGKIETPDVLIDDIDISG